MKVNVPFKYGKVVSEPYFVNRTKELSEISTNLMNGTNLVLYAPRRYGKTSLAQKVLKNLEKDAICIFVDFFQVVSLEKFISIYTGKILEQKKLSLEDTIKMFKKFVSGISANVTLDDSGNPAFNFTYQPGSNKEQSLTDVLELPTNIFKNERVVVVFDEFQEINKLNGDNFENQLRSVIQFHQNVSYLFMGSQTHLLLNMFNNKNRAFYNIGKVMKIGKIHEEEMMDYLLRQFNKFDLTVDQETVETIIKISDNIPHYTQFLAYELWQLAQLKECFINDELIDEAVGRIINNQSDFYNELVDRLTNYQKKVLLALMKENTNIFSGDYARKYNLSSTSTTQRAIGKLIETGIIEKMEKEYHFSDPFFKRYLSSVF
jgi:AAA+ ATPase superfamily predicted ATPase